MIVGGIYNPNQEAQKFFYVMFCAWHHESVHELCENYVVFET